MHSDSQNTVFKIHLHDRKELKENKIGARSK